MTTTFKASNTSPEAAIRRFRASLGRRAQLSRRLEFDWPCTRQICHRMAEYFTEGFAGPSPRRGKSAPTIGPLLYHALDAGLAAYHASEDRGDRDRFVSFVEASFREAEAQFSKVMLSGSRGNLWSPAALLPLSQWLEAVSLPDVRLQLGPAAATGSIVAALTEFALSAEQRDILIEAQSCC